MTERSEWQPWFAWYPVMVDAYNVDEIVDHKLRYPCWLCGVEWRVNPFVLGVDFFQYRPLQKTKK